MEDASNTVHREPWNKGKIVGQKAPFKLKDIWVGIPEHRDRRFRTIVTKHSART